MKFTLSWLKDHLDTEAALDEIVETLTKIGLEVDGVEDPAAKLSGFVVARVIEAKPHPNADRLRVCLVDAGTGAPAQVVCGAPNARTGMVSVFSPPGTFIPGKKTVLGAGVIRGVESNGMLCSEAELELSNEHDGIIDLPADAPVGAPYAAFAGLDDPVIDVALTPNRPDAASVQGIARDLAAAGLGRFKVSAPAPVEGSFPCPVDVRLALDPADAHLCPLFALRLVRGVKNGPSPDWMRRRLAAIGLRPINALVDITNYVTFDRGRPLHVFDAAKVRGTAIAVRRARDGESLEALNGRTYALDPSMVVIADDSGPESLAGIMGGEASGCDEATLDVLIESALWDPVTVAQTGRKLGIATDARYRFERGVDPAFCVPGLDLATALVLDLCGGEPSARVVAGTVPDAERRIAFPWREVPRLTGLDLPRDEMRHTLEALGFGVAEGPRSEEAEVRVPSWRPDVHGKPDLVEEIVRIAGLDRVEPRPLGRPTAVAEPVLTPLQRRTRLAKRALAACGMVEAVTWSFISAEQARLFGGGSPDLELLNPIAPDLSTMRPSLLPGLIAAAGRNAARGTGDIALFEVGQVFLGVGESDQRMAAAGLRRGTAKASGAGRHWSGAAGPVDVFDAKADAETLLDALGIPLAGLHFEAGGPDFLHPGRSLALATGPEAKLGLCGELHPDVLRAFDVTGPIVCFEIILDALPAPKWKPTRARSKLVLPDLMPVDRDFAFLVERATPAAALVDAARSAERALVSRVAVFDVYEGRGVPEGRKSVALTVTLQPRDTTLTDADLEAASSRIVAAVTRRTGGVLRG